MRSYAKQPFVTGAVTAMLAVAAVCAAPRPADAQPARTMYTAALSRERGVRDAERKPTLKQLRAAASAYVRVVSRHPRSGYSDNSLWQAAGLYALAYERFRQESDRREAQRMLDRLRAEYPSSSLISRAGEFTSILAARPAVGATAGRRTPPVSRAAAPAPLPPAVTPPAVETASGTPASIPVSGMLTAIRRAEIGNVVRITLELDSEIAYHEERVDGPARVFFDLKNVKLGSGLRETPLHFTSDVLKQVRLGRRDDGSTRVAMDLDGVSRYSVFTLYNPYRLVVDFERVAPAVSVSNSPHAPPAPPPAAPAMSTLPVGSSPLRVKSAPVMPAPRSTAPSSTLPSEPTDASETPVPTAPAVTGKGNYSLARQLGLGIARVVIDPGHGGHDPGAQGFRVTESELVLDVALRLQKLLLKQNNIDVVMTRNADVFVPLEERTAMANRAAADLFLSIHANASENLSARGVETYYLNFASNPDAEAVAARENSASSRTMHVLPDIIKAIALNDKLDESRDFAEQVQTSMSKRLRTHNARLKSLGVKRAPFVVLIGAGMPSVLAEISFVTNRQEATLLRTGAYRQHIAEALFDAVTQYQRSLKKVTAVADGTSR